MLGKTVCTNTKQNTKLSYQPGIRSPELSLLLLQRVYSPNSAHIPSLVVSFEPILLLGTQDHLYYLSHNISGATELIGERDEQDPVVHSHPRNYWTKLMTF